MTDERDNARGFVAERFPRRTDEKLDRLLEGQGQQAARLSAIEEKQGFIFRGIARIDARLDSLDRRVDRIERRLDIADASVD